MKVYNIDINEYQRLLFIKALQHLIKTNPEELKTLAGDISTILPNGTMLEEAEMLKQIMVEDMNEPDGTTYGFCY